MSMVDIKNKRLKFVRYSPVITNQKGILVTQGASGTLPHGKWDGFPTINIPNLEQFALFEGNSHIFPTHKSKSPLCNDSSLCVES